MKVTKITIGRLYNLGNYEHVRYELTVEVPEGESAAQAVKGMENILAGLRPMKQQNISTATELKRMADELNRMRTMPAAEWDRHYMGYTGTPSQIIARHEQSLEEATQKARLVCAMAKRARELFDDLGGAAEWRDAKTDWADYNFDQDQP